MKLIEIISGAIGKVWKFATTILLIAIISIIAFFVLTVVMPDNVLRAVEIVTGYITGFFP